MLRHCLALGLAAALAQPALAETDRNAKVMVGWAGPFDTLNPATTGGRNVGPIAVNVFDTLVWLTSDFQLTPGLATKWEVSEDKKTYTFTLREGVTFHDGTPFDADAVVANFDYIGDKTTQSKISLSLLGSCSTAKAVSKYVVQVSCTKPYAPLLAQLGEPYLGIQSAPGRSASSATWPGRTSCSSATKTTNGTPKPRSSAVRRTSRRSRSRSSAPRRRGSASSRPGSPT